MNTSELTVSKINSKSPINQIGEVFMWPENGPLIGQNLNRLSPKSDQHQLSPNNIDTSSK